VWPTITRDDVAVVIGGGKGIAAECALLLARQGAAIVLVGRSPADDPEVAATLARAQRDGFRFRYVEADALQPDGLSGALQPALAVSIALRGRRWRSTKSDWRGATSSPGRAHHPLDRCTERARPACQRHGDSHIPPAAVLG
jgi:NAD(P)-dependent dehydrogenase (short-subunit alcohol dehydrogenase family)